MGIPARVAAIEFAGDEVRVSVVKTGRRLPVVLELQSRVAHYSTEDERFEAMVQAVDEAVSALETRPAAFVLCAPSLYSVVRMLTIPFKGKRRVAAAVPFELEPYLAFPLEELMVDYTVVSEAGGKTEVLAVGVRRPLLQEQMAILAGAGVEAEAADLDAVGLTMLWQAVHRPGKGLSAVLHVREEGSVLAILNGKSLAFFRSIDAGAQQLAERPNAVAREVQNSIRGFLARWQAEVEITDLYVTGVDWDDRDREIFSQALRLTVRSEILLEQLKGGGEALRSV
ncbi:MAG: pilus assembly protein PilM, partial [Candidatus Hydrogenedentes bacterium]|nr:pilus assembly protein PilM [Candidatus Hydrogenedentota bacterium]